MDLTLLDRLSTLEERVDKLEKQLLHSPPSLVEGLPDIISPINNNPELPDGAVTFGGSVAVGKQIATYQWARPTHWITDNTWEEQIGRIAALAHPVRGEILRYVLCDPATAAKLVSAGVVSSMGTAYHHLNELQAGGWVTKANGAYSVPPSRVIALMTIITAAEAH
ncbi:winged helix-turn-helix domain-containing protein [Corynebacterium mayonis]|uniref:winged helix-turn-helix domain-containing protein n=1 Tax=Corynebacterium mayonis TaxID=3062461 RepID=UPI0031404561